MNEHIEELYREVHMMIENRDGFTGNGKDLLRLDFEGLSDTLDAMQDTVEKHEDSYIIDKDDFGDLVANAMRKMFFAADGQYLTTDEEDYPDFLGVFTGLLEEEIENNEKA